MKRFLKLKLFAILGITEAYAQVLEAEVKKFDKVVSATEIIRPVDADFNAMDSRREWLKRFDSQSVSENE